MEREIEEKFDIDPFESNSNSMTWKSFGGIRKPVYNPTSYSKPLGMWENENERLQEILEYKHAFRAATHSQKIIKTNFPGSFLEELTKVTVEEIVNAITGLIVVDKVDSVNGKITLSELVMEDGRTDMLEAVVEVENNSFAVQVQWISKTTQNAKC